MDPLIKSPDAVLPLEDVLNSYTRSELEELLREGDEPGICEQSFEENFYALFEKDFGKKALNEARKACR